MQCCVLIVNTSHDKFQVLCALGAMFSSSVSALVLVDTQCHHQQQELESVSLYL